jgi:hypothetical protein
VVDDAVHDGAVCQERDDLHRAAALRADQRINFVDFTDHLGPALGKDALELILDNPDRERLKACLLDLPPMGVGIEAILC